MTTLLPIALGAGNDTSAPRSTSSRTSGRSIGASTRHGAHSPSIANSPTPSAPATAHGSARAAAERGTAAGDATPGNEAPSVVMSVNRKRATAMSPTLTLRSFSRHLWMSVTSGRGTSAGSADQSGVDFTTAAVISVVSSPANGRTPASIS